MVIKNIKTNFTIRHGFTLVELLVVISIIALLLAILMPSLQKARNQAITVVCRSNLKQINLAAALWSVDNEGWVLPATWSHSSSTSGEVKDRLNSYLAAEKQGKGIYRCPIIKSEPGGWDPVAGEYTGNLSYGMNIYLCVAGPGPGTSGTLGTGDLGSAMWGPGAVYFYEHGNTKALAIRNPAKVIYFMDFWSYRVGQGFFGDTYPGSPAPTHKDKGRRHIIGKTRPDAGKANVAWCDGSVSIEPSDFEMVKGTGRGGTIYSINAIYFQGTQ